MESVFFYGEKTSKDIKKIIKEDDFMRISYIERESNLPKRNGYFLYVQASQDEIKNIEQKFKDLDVEKLSGDEEKTIIDSIKKEEESAASGMGMIFG